MTEASLIGGSRAAVRLERYLPDPPETVWKALTDREQLRAWFPCDVAVEGSRWEPGRPITFQFPPDVIEMTLSGEVLRVEEPRILEFTWGDETLRFDLTPSGTGTHLVLVDELPAVAAARNAAGWDECLDRLAGFERGREDWRSRFEAYCVSFEPGLGNQEGPPASFKG